MYEVICWMNYSVWYSCTYSLYEALIWHLSIATFCFLGSKPVTKIWFTKSIYGCDGLVNKKYCNLSVSKWSLTEHGFCAVNVTVTDFCVERLEYLVLHPVVLDVCMYQNSCLFANISARRADYQGVSAMDGNIFVTWPILHGDTFSIPAYTGTFFNALLAFIILYAK